MRPINITKPLPIEPSHKEQEATVDSIFSAVNVVIRPPTPRSRASTLGLVGKGESIGQRESRK